MKKLITILTILLSFAHISLFALEIPEQLYGIWEGKDRIIFFENDESTKEPQIVIILKEYYGWYYDRAVEPKSYSEKEKRTRNTGTTRNAENVYIDDIIIASNNSDSLATTLKLKYSNHQFNEIPVCIINDNLYLNYMQKTEVEQNDNNIVIYKGVALSKGFLVSEQSIPENISGFIIDQNKLYDVRYWKSDMEFSDETALFKYENDEYQVPKHIFSAGNNYSCVSGRSKKIRNTVKPFEYKEDDYIFNNDKSVLILQKEPYLTKLTDKKTFEDLMLIVKQANARRKPDSDPLFPPQELDWHWDLIDRLEADNKIIQAVRERQRAFGKRSH